VDVIFSGKGREVDITVFRWAKLYTLIVKQYRDEYCDNTVYSVNIYIYVYYSELYLHIFFC
jgi:hypothetical protein